MEITGRLVDILADYISLLETSEDYFGRNIEALNDLYVEASNNIEASNNL